MDQEVSDLTGLQPEDLEAIEVLRLSSVNFHLCIYNLTDMWIIKNIFFHLSYLWVSFSLKIHGCADQNKYMGIWKLIQVGMMFVNLNQLIKHLPNETSEQQCSKICPFSAALAFKTSTPIIVRWWPPVFDLTKILFCYLRPNFTHDWSSKVESTKNIKPK